MRNSFLSLMIILSMFCVNAYAHEEHEHKEEHHDEGKTEISATSMKNSGIKISKASSGIINDVVDLFGVVTLNENKTANVGARFDGIVRSIHANLGDYVTQGQGLVTIEANNSLQSYSVNAPISGTIISRNTNLGDVTRQEPLFRITDLSNLWVKLYVFSKDYTKIKIGQSILFTTMEGKNQTSGMVIMSSPVADPDSQTRIAIVSVDNKDLFWQADMRVKAKAIISQHKAKVIVPLSAIQTIENEMVIFKNHGNEFEKSPVTLGKNDGVMTEILSGLNVGESYASQGSFVVKADMLKSGAAHEH